MKNYTFILFLMIPLLTWSQGPSLTKEETVNYINKKVQESQSHYRQHKMDGANTFLYYWGTHGVTLNNGNVKVAYSRSNYKTQPPFERKVVGSYAYSTLPCNFYTQYYTYEFNPAHIVKIEKSQNISEYDPVGMAVVTLLGTTGKYFYSGKISNKSVFDNYGYKQCYSLEETASEQNSVSQIFIPFLQSDPSNFNKLYKALEYLRDIYKIEDDPFGS